MKLQMRVSRSGLELVKRFEGLRRRAARLPRGGWTIGYGHTLSAREGAEVGPQDAEALLLYDLNRAAEVVDEVVFTPVNQNQFDALVAFAFNIGVENFRGSAVLKRLNEGCYLKAAAALELWRKADFDGESLVVDALIRRRAAEKALFLTPPEGFRPVPTPVVRPTLDIALMSQMEPVVLDVPMDGDVAKVVFDPAAQEPPMAEASVVTAKLHQLFPDAVVALALVPEAEDEHELDPEDEPIAEAEVDPSQAELDLVSLPPFASEPAPAAPEILSEAEPMLAAAPSGHRFFEPPPRRFPAAAGGSTVLYATPAAANEGDPVPAAEQAAPEPFVPEFVPDFVPDAVVPEPARSEPAVAEASEPFMADSMPVAVEGRTEFQAMALPPAPKVEDVRRAVGVTVQNGPAAVVVRKAGRPWLLQVSVGLLGVALFAGAIYSMFNGEATLVNLGIGLVGVVLMVPAGVHLLLALSGSDKPEPAEKA